MNDFGVWLGTLILSLLELARLAFPAVIVLAANPCRGSDFSQTTVTLVGSSSNMFFIAINASVNLPGWPNERRTPAGLLESNGLYSIDIGMEAPEELLPAGPRSMPLQIGQILAIYAELTGVELQVDEDVRNFPGLLRLPNHSEMTRPQAREFVETALREQADVEVFQEADSHVSVRFRKGAVSVNPF